MFSILTQEEIYLEQERINMNRDIDILCLEHANKLQRIEDEIMCESYSQDISRNMFRSEFEYFSEQTESLWERFKKWVTGIINAMFGGKLKDGEGNELPPVQGNDRNEEEDVGFNLGNLRKAIKDAVAIIGTICAGGVGLVLTIFAGLKILGTEINLLDPSSYKPALQEVKDKIFKGKKEEITAGDLEDALAEGESLVKGVQKKVDELVDNPPKDNTVWAKAHTALTTAINWIKTTLIDPLKAKVRQIRIKVTSKVKGLKGNKFKATIRQRDNGNEGTPNNDNSNNEEQAKKESTEDLHFDLLEEMTTFLLEMQEDYTNLSIEDYYI